MASYIVSIYKTASSHILKPWLFIVYDDAIVFVKTRVMKYHRVKFRFIDRYQLE